MSKGNDVSYGIAFGASLILSWTMITAIVALAAWSGDRSAGSFARWFALWVFTVAAPTLQSLNVHRTLKTLVRAYPDVPARIRRDLTHVRWTLLMFGTMAALSAFAIGLG
jgi:hypothetical protein